MSGIHALVITGYGINCEKEMALACDLAGARTEIAHAHALLHNQIDLGQYHLICFPGGFAFGDELGAAKVLANRMRGLRDRLQNFVAEGRCILGICNGFQLLVKLGLLPGQTVKQAISLTYNDHARFDDRWVCHDVATDRCVFTQGLARLNLPIRHGEGKFVLSDDALAAELASRCQVAFRYAGDNPNGSYDRIAGICDPTGRILGMMAHPEAALFPTNHPDWLRRKEEAKRNQTPLPDHGEGYFLFKNAVEFLKGTV